MAKLDNRITKPISVDSRGNHAIVDEAPDGSKAIPVVFVTKKAEGSFGYDGEVDPNTELDNDIKAPIARDAAGIAEVVDEDIDGKKAIPLVVYTKDDEGKLVPANIGAGGGGGGDSVSWSNVTNKPQAFPPSEHNHDERYWTKEQAQDHVDFVKDLMEQEQGKVASHEGDELGYLQSKVDNVTLSIQGSELKVVNVDGLTIGVANINAWLSGTESNIQGQINGINDTLASLTTGMRYRGKFESHAELTSIGNNENGDLAVVLTDETRDDSRSMYVYNETLGYWDFIGSFEFSDEFIALSDTPNSYAGADGKVVKVSGGRLVFDDVDYADITNKPSSTITQIDDAVAKRHEHGNKATLDRVGIIEQNGEKILTIDGIPYEPKREKKEIFSAYLSSSSITVEANNYIKWDTVKPLSTIPYDASTGLFTLTPGKSYKVIVSVMGEISNYITIHFARGTEKVRSNPYAPVYGATTVNNRGGSGVLAATFTIGESSAGLYGILVGEIGDKESVRLFNNRTMILIEEIEI